MDCNVIEKNIEAYLDGELTLSDRRDFEEHIADCQTCVNKLENLRSIQGIVKQSDYVNVPSSLKSGIQNRLRDYTGEDSKTFGLLHWLGLGGGAMATGSLATWLLMTFLLASPIQMHLTDEIISSHIHSLMADHVTDVKSSDRHTVKPWFNGRVDFSPPVQDLTAAGYKLIGGRLDYIQGKTVSALVYKRRAHIINTFIFKTDDKEKNPAMQTFHRQGYNLIHWSADGLDYWIISDLNTKELDDFARLLFG